jgi:hypothetical protein
MLPQDEHAGRPGAEALRLQHMAVHPRRLAWRLAISSCSPTAVQLRNSMESFALLSAT